jgi:hypothetical protein
MIFCLIQTAKPLPPLHTFLAAPLLHSSFYVDHTHKPLRFSVSGDNVPPAVSKSINLETEYLDIFSYLIL